jgi:uncharacterized protein
VILATVDTNVLASGLLGLTRHDSTPGELYRRWRAGAFLLATSEPLVDEFIRTLAQSFFRTRVSPTDVAETVALLIQSTIPLTQAVHGVATHPEDDVVISTSLSAQAEYLVTGDRQLQQLHRYQSLTIVSPREFLEDILPRADPVPVRHG